MADVYFHGIPLENIAGAKITDITVGPVKWTATARARPIRAGADFVRLVGGERTVVMTFALLQDDMEQRQQDLGAIAGWLRTDTPQRLVLPGFPGLYLLAICTEFPEPYLRQWWQELRVTWTCYDPYWYDMTEKTCACGTAFTVMGSAPPEMRITHTLESAADLTYTDGTNTITLADVPAGEFVLDLDRQTAAVGGVSVMACYDFASTWIIPRTGQTTITGSGTVHWRERWV